MTSHTLVNVVLINAHWTVWNQTASQFILIFLENKHAGAGSKVWSLWLIRIHTTANRYEFITTPDAVSPENQRGSHSCYRKPNGVTFMVITPFDWVPCLGKLIWKQEWAHTKKRAKLREFCGLDPQPSKIMLSTQNIQGIAISKNCPWPYSSSQYLAQRPTQCGLTY